MIRFLTFRNTVIRLLVVLRLGFMIILTLLLLFFNGEGNKIRFMFPYI